MGYLIKTERFNPKTRTETFINMTMPDVFFSESKSLKVNSNMRDTPEKVSTPDSCYCFYFYDIEVVQLEGEAARVHGSNELRSRAKNKSNTYYPGATIHALEDIAKMKGDYKILMWNIKNNDKTGNPRGIRCRTDNWILFEKGDIII